MYWTKFAKVEMLIFLVAIVPTLLFENTSYSTGLYIVGTFFLLYLVYSELGQWLQPRSPKYMYGSTVGLKSMDQESFDAMRENKASLREFAEALPIGLLPILAAAILEGLT